MAQIHTPLTKLLNIKTPILCAPMAIPGTDLLATAVTAAGGFGLMGAGASSIQEIKEKLDNTRKALNSAPGEPVPIGIGFLGCILDKTESSPDPRLEAILEEKPIAVWLAFGVDLGKYVARIHAFDAKRDHKTIIFVIVNSVEAALQAANKWKVDVIVAQGIEAGGHGGANAPPLLTLLQAILLALPNGPLVVAAGGVSTGKQIAALLTMGAAGVALGTRFLFTDEIKYTPKKKEVLLQAGIVASTVRTLAFDEVGKTDFWPPDVDGRAINNNIVRDAEEGLSLDQRLQRFTESAAAGESSRMIVWAGQGVGLTKKITSAEVAVQELHEEAVESLQAATKFLGA